MTISEVCEITDDLIKQNPILQAAVQAGENFAKEIMQNGPLMSQMTSQINLIELFSDDIL
ncbi:hypothetical protein OAG24_01000 [bacterium]|nr:hypothetical protein [bacterium]